MNIVEALVQDTEELKMTINPSIRRDISKRMIYLYFSLPNSWKLVKEGKNIEITLGKFGIWLHDERGISFSRHGIQNLISSTTKRLLKDRFPFMNTNQFSSLIGLFKDNKVRIVVLPIEFFGKDKVSDIYLRAVGEAL